MEGFSVFNISAIVQIADTIVRLGMETAGLYSRFRNASNDINLLLDEIKLLVNIVGEVESFKKEYYQSPQERVDLQKPMEQLEIVLRACERELWDLRLFASNVKAETTDRWVRQMLKGLNWAVKEKRIANSCQHIMSYRTTLNSILSLIGRKNDNRILNETKNMQKMSTAFFTFEKSHSASLRTMESSLCASHDALININNNIRFQGQKLYELTSLMREFSNSTLRETEDDTFVFNGTHPESAVLPLMLMKSDLHKAIEEMAEKDTLNISYSEADWIRKEFDILYANSLRAAALDLASKSCTRRTRPAPMSPSEEAKVKVYFSLYDSSINSFYNIQSNPFLATSQGWLLFEYGLFPIFQSERIFRVSFYPHRDLSSVGVRIYLYTAYGNPRHLQARLYVVDNNRGGL